jgi:hypothetical protein
LQKQFEIMWMVVTNTKRSKSSLRYF